MDVSLKKLDAAQLNGRKIAGLLFHRPDGIELLKLDDGRLLDLWQLNMIASGAGFPDQLETTECWRDPTTIDETWELTRFFEDEDLLDLPVEDAVYISFQGIKLWLRLKGGVHIGYVASETDANICTMQAPAFKEYSRQVILT